MLRGTRGRLRRLAVQRANGGEGRERAAAIKSNRQSARCPQSTWAARFTARARRPAGKPRTHGDATLPGPERCGKVLRGLDARCIRDSRARHPPFTAGNELAPILAERLYSSSAAFGPSRSPHKRIKVALLLSRHPSLGKRVNRSLGEIAIVS